MVRCLKVARDCLLLSAIFRNLGVSGTYSPAETFSYGAPGACWKLRQATVRIPQELGKVEHIELFRGCNASLMVH